MDNRFFVAPSKPSPWSFMAAVLSVLVLMPSASAFAQGANPGPFVDCETVGDTLGFAVAGGGDYNGDGVNDVAYSAPCSRVDDMDLAGRVFVRSGANGSLLKRVLGTQREGFMGSTLAFVGDIDGDGKDDLAVGSPAFDVADPTQPGITFVNGGRVQIFAHRRKDAILSVIGSISQGEFGVSLAGVGDVNDDGHGDFIVGETGGRNPIRTGRGRTGAVHVISGADGSIVESLFGEKAGQQLGISVANVGAVDDDGLDDVVVTSTKPPVGGVRLAGHVAVVPAADVLADPFFEDSGARADRLGAASDADGLDGNFVTGAPGRKVTGIKGAGVAVAYDHNGDRIFEVPDVVVQKNALFGTAVAAVGDANADDTTDYAAAAPFADILVSQEDGFLQDGGRVSLLDGVDGSVLWSLDGTTAGEKVGRALAGGIDYNNDGAADLISGSPGAAPNGRRGAGTVSIHSGVDGSVLKTFNGRRGLETRIFVLGPVRGGTVRSFDVDGKRREVNARIFFARDAGEELSIDVVGENASRPQPGGLRLVAGTGHRARLPLVAVLSASDRQTIFTRFNASSAFSGYSGGVTVAAGDLNNDGEDRLAVAMADSLTGDVDVAIFRELIAGSPDGDGWLLDNLFPAFTNADSIDTGTDEFPTPVLINADGANVEIAKLTSDPGQEIVVAPISGVPVVRLLTKDGVLIREWLAYSNLTTSGVNLAIADLDGDGSQQIITAPVSGAPLIRAFNANGTAFVPAGSGEPVAFLARGGAFSAGAHVSASDVDFDGKQEILVVLGGNRSDQVLAFEADGSPVEGFKNFSPFNGNATGGGTDIVASDRYLRD